MRDYIQSKHDEQKRKKNRKIKCGIVIFVLLLVLIALVFLLRSDIYTIQTIEVTIENTDTNVQNDIRTVAETYITKHDWFSSLFLHERSVLGFNGHGLAFYIANQYPIVTEVSVSVNYITRVVSISGKERTKEALWCTHEGNCGWFDDAGVVFLEGFSAQGSSINKITSSATSTVMLLEYIPIDAHFVESVFSFLEEFRAPVRHLIWDDSKEELHTEAISGFPTIFFSTKQDPQYALEELKKISHIEKLSYIDLRVKNRIFYK
jgi:hypothetical protein